MYYALVELQTRLIRRVDDAATDLLRADYVTIAAPVPALVLAHQVYGDATRAEELTTRNSLTDPNFVPTGTEIEVLR
jgi:prophage DNA circulation protein